MTMCITLLKLKYFLVDYFYFCLMYFIVSTTGLKIWGFIRSEVRIFMLGISRSSIDLHLIQIYIRVNPISLPYPVEIEPTTISFISLILGLYRHCWTWVWYSGAGLEQCLSSTQIFDSSVQGWRGERGGCWG